MAINWNGITPGEARQALDRYEVARKREYTRSMLRGKKIKWALQGQWDLFGSKEDANYWFHEASLLRSWAEEAPWIRERLEKVELVG